MKQERKMLEEEMKERKENVEEEIRQIKRVFEETSVSNTTVITYYLTSVSNKLIQLITNY